MAELPILIEEPTIRRRVEEIGEQITADLAGEPLVVVCPLGGAVVFAADLIRRIDLPVTLTHVAMATYAGPSTGETGEVRLLLDVAERLEGRHVLLVDGAVVSGAAVKFIYDLLQVRRPASLRTCVLLVKKGALRVDLPITYMGFEVGDAFAVGYGIQHQGQHAGLPHVAAVAD